ncbi:MAG: putative motility protein [Clostridiales bacterium]|nr:putative motility protein [Clostridiales bacterium]
MSVGAVSTAMAQQSLANQVSLSVTKMAMDTSEQDANALLKLMELSVNPNVGSNFDARV